MSTPKDQKFKTENIPSPESGSNLQDANLPEKCPVSQFSKTEKMTQELDQSQNAKSNQINS